MADRLQTADKMATLVLYFSLIVIYVGVDCQITNSPDSKEICVGDNVKLDWVYGDAANFAGITWTYIDSSSSQTVIMQHASGGNAVVIGGYNVQHDGNGALTLTDVTLANSGSYKIDVTYTSATAADANEVSVTVKDPPSGLGYTDIDSVITCTASSLGTPAASVYLEVDGKNVGVSAKVDSGKKAKCCLTGSAVDCMKTASCVQVRDLCTWFVYGYQLHVCIIILIVIIIICICGLEFLIGCWIGCTMYGDCNCCKDIKSCLSSDCHEICQCCDDDCVRWKCCKCSLFCNDDDFQLWYRRLSCSVIGFPVTLGIYLARFCCSRPGSSPDAKHTANSKSRPPKTRISDGKSGKQLPHPEISPEDGAYGGGKDTRIEMKTFAESKRKLTPVCDVPGHDIHEKLQGIPKKRIN